MSHLINLPCDLSFADFIDPEFISEICDSDTYMHGAWMKRADLRGFQNGVKKTVIPVSIKHFRLFIITTVEPGVAVEKHAHNEAILRVVISGSFILNGKTYHAGDWVVIPKKCAYEMSTEEGYTTAACYGMSCDPGA